MWHLVKYVVIINLDMISHSRAQHQHTLAMISHMVGVRKASFFSRAAVTKLMQYRTGGREPSSELRSGRGRVRGCAQRTRPSITHAVMYKALAMRSAVT